jgi:Arc/MetJ-type ribon-helix-helix transcriptional regulator
MSGVTIHGRTLKSRESVRITLRLPRQFYERVKRQVEREQMGSVNDFIVNAVIVYAKAVERKAIDDSFSGMAHDKQYQREALRIVKEFGG